MMITKTEARKAASEWHETQYEEQMSNIDQEIRQAAYGGEFVIRHYQDIRNDVREKLIENGFELNPVVEDGPNDFATIIKW